MPREGSVVVRNSNHVVDELIEIGSIFSVHFVPSTFGCLLLLSPLEKTNDWAAYMTIYDTKVKELVKKGTYQSWQFPFNY